MVFDLTTLLLATAVIILFVYLKSRGHSRLPPFPARPWPLVGNLVHLEKNPRQQFLRWRKEHGDIYSLYMGRQLVIVLNGYDSINELLVKNGNKTSDRPFFYFDKVSGSCGKGVVFSSGDLWKEQREVTMSILRTLGMGKNVMAETILDCVQPYLETMANLKGAPTELNTLTTVSVSNVISNLLLGHRFKLDDKDLAKCVTYVSDVIRDAGENCLINYFPFLQYIPFDVFNSKAANEKGRYIMDVFVQKFVQQKGYDEYDEHNADNFIAAYIKERNRRLQAGRSTTMDDINLKKCIYDLFIAGTETAAITLVWCVLYLIHYPDMQEKLYQEVEKHVGVNRLPTMNDKTNLSLVNAFILEVLRVASIVPFAPFHKTTEDITVGNYTIPAGASLMPNLDSVLWDEDIWGKDAKDFRPERFINNDGSIKQQAEYIAFSAGKRVCAGESLARMELFLFFASMIQRFKFLPVDPAAPPALKAADDLGFTAPARPYQVRAVDRRIIG